MSDEPENPPAFPVPEQNLPGFVDSNGVNWSARKIPAQPGLTMRDYFAAHCPVTFTEFLSGWRGTSQASLSESLDAFASLRVNYADAMLKARQL